MFGFINRYNQALQHAPLPRLNTVSTKTTVSSKRATGFYSGEHEMRYTIGAKCFIAGLIIAGIVTMYALHHAI